MAEARLLTSSVIEPGGYIATKIITGQVLRVTNIEGKQVGDLIAFAADDLSERFWVSNTIRLNGSIYLTTGNVLYSELSRPMLQILASSGEPHDLLAGSCNAEIDNVRYGVEGHRGCVENFCEALRPWGLRRCDIPMSFNLFMNCPVQPDGTWSIEEPNAGAGDYVEFLAKMDLVVAISNCPQDLNPCNAGRRKPLLWEIFQGPGDAG